jgi:S-adenosylmethionine hydrolase
MQPLPVFTFTDFGNTGPYLGQVEERLFHADPGIRVIHLVTDAPAFAPVEAGYLLAALAGHTGPGVFLAVIDPGVGGERQPVVVQSGDHWLVGPDNGLFAALISHDPAARLYSINYRPARMSATFHGRDLFAPVAGKLATGRFVALEPICRLSVNNCPEDLARIVYIDHYGNLMTGMRADKMNPGQQLLFAGLRLDHAGCFGDVAPGMPFWYENSLGLVEISVNRGSARQRFSATVGMEVGFHDIC